MKAIQTQRFSASAHVRADTDMQLLMLPVDQTANAFLVSLNPNDVLDIKTGIFSSGKYEELTTYLVSITYLENI